MAIVSFSGSLAVMGGEVMGAATYGGERALQRFYLGQAHGCYVAMFCTRSPRYGRVCATLAYRGCA